MKYTLKELIDVPKLQELTDELYMAASIPSAIITMDGEILTGSGWQRICTEFHRRHPQIEKECIESDIKIREQLDQGELFAIYKCPRGLVDASSPVIISGEHVANVFAGQVFLESPDESTEQFFREQAQKFGFDEAEYIKAFKEIPVFTEKKFRSATGFLSKLAQMIADMTFLRLQELETEKALQISEERLDLAIKGAGIGLWDWNIQTGATVFNERWAEIAGYDLEELSPASIETWIDLCHPDDLEKSNELIEEHFAGITEYYYCEARMKHKDGHWIWVADRGKIFEWTKDGKPLRATGIHIDITERKKAEKALIKAHDELEQRVEERTLELRKTHEQLLHSEKLSALGSLSASIAHEFNNPLTGITNVIQGLKKRATYDKDDAELIDLAITECARIKDLIKSLQDFNRPSSGRMAPIDIHTTIDSLLVLSKEEHKTKGITVETNFSANMPKVKAVADQIKQAILNLLRNAVYACDGGGIISINTEVTRNKVILEIRDDGKGIKPEHMDHIFDPFFTTKPEVKGIGLGLSISYGIIKNHGGRIDVKSEPGKGTTISVTLPVEEVNDVEQSKSDFL